MQNNNIGRMRAELQLQRARITVQTSHAFSLRKKLNEGLQSVEEGMTLRSICGARRQQLWTKENGAKGVVRICSLNIHYCMHLLLPLPCIFILNKCRLYPIPDLWTFICEHLACQRIRLCSVKLPGIERGQRSLMRRLICTSGYECTFLHFDMCNYVLHEYMPSVPLLLLQRANSC